MDKMGEAQLRSALRQKTKQELLDIWVGNKRHEWPDGAFDVIKEELAAKGIKPPAQKNLEESMLKGRDYRKDVGQPFFAVSQKKLALMAFFTWGFYEIYWFYRNWKFLKEKHDFKVSPLARGIFGPLFCYSLFKIVRDYSDQHQAGADMKAGALAACYILMIVTYKLPSPFDLISSFSFIPLLTVQRVINNLGQRLSPQAQVDGRFNGWNIFGIVIGSFLWVLVILGIIFPETGK
ncbi:Na(+)/H(+) antiporter NhaA 2 [Candidatus Velamenicoccus archaeovorus]|uniref:Na(+)/H(+) antiporter NhaA 2 n=1 Tax=Velamenicoccus archaeovorus TaxID=1930593 RepID=A0A410P378_VELA1|nr:hypothetical protein [Candidatus Velamenicoccus archaeovorus]QAT16552.1 Na(+)/H(+) antiporter NhaA 2 [Candidatus Velamenicoccus archaeovorus]